MITPDFETLELLTVRSITEGQRITLTTEQGWAPYMNFLFHLAAYMQPNLIVELGVLHGLSTAHLAAGSPNSAVIGMDISLRAVCPEFHWQNVIFVEGDPLSFRLGFPKHSPGIGLLFIDSEHIYDVTFPQYRHFRPLMAKGGIILFDDIHLCAEMERVWEEITEPKIELNELHDTGFGATLT